MKNLMILDWVAITLVVIGGINWGLVGLFNTNLVGVIFGDLTIVSRIIYTLVALSAIYLIIIAPKLSRKI